MSATEIAGVKPTRNWNSAAGAAGSLSSLNLADGTAVAASVSWTSPVGGSAMGISQVGYTDQPGDTRMMNGYLDPGDPGMPATVTVSGLPASFAAGGVDVGTRRLPDPQRVLDGPNAKGQRDATGADQERVVIERVADPVLARD